MRGQAHLYNERTGKFQTQPKTMKVGTVRVRKDHFSIVTNADSVRYSGAAPKTAGVAGVVATVRVNGKLIHVRTRTYDGYYSSWGSVEVFKTESGKVVFGLEKATAIRAAKKAWAERLGVFERTR